jgi:hypothetical protein
MSFFCDSDCRIQRKYLTKKKFMKEQLIIERVKPFFNCLLLLTCESTKIEYAPMLIYTLNVI